MSEQVDIAVDLGAIPPPLPDICFFEEFAASPPTVPPQIIESILHQGCKMILGGTSKSNKSWCLLDLAITGASGQRWWGRRCTKLPVVYINYELQPWYLHSGARDCSGDPGWFRICICDDNGTDVPPYSNAVYSDGL